MISMGSHVKFARFVLLAVSEEAQEQDFFCFVQCLIKQFIRFGFCYIQNNQGLDNGCCYY